MEQQILNQQILDELKQIRIDINILRKNKTFRIRVGDYRVLYVIIKRNNDLLIANTDRRPKVYD